MIVPAFLCHLRKDNFESGNDRIQWLVGEIDRAADQFLQTSAHAGDRDKASGLSLIHISEPTRRS